MARIILTVNDEQLTVEEGLTILDALKEYDIPVPTLCYHDYLNPMEGAGCRMCVVESKEPSI